MSVRVVFTEGGEPLSALKLRDGQEEFQTDEHGHLELALSSGRTTLMVFHRDQWVSKSLSVSDGASMVLVDMEEKSPETAKHSSEGVSFSDVGRIELGDRYVYDRVIGHGGMSIVIRAKDRLLNRKVAIKLLNQELQESDEAQHMFLTEARNLATLSHPYLVAVHDITKIDNKAMMVMEYIRGENMERLMRKFDTGMPEHVASRLCTQFAQVLGYLHDEGIVHRDVKLANAMIRHDGTLKLIDFGLARKFDELYIRGTRVRGTPAYMSPEQIKGKELTPASDIYQLGVCMYEVFTGQLPFTKGDISYAHVHEQPVHPMLVNTDLHPDIAELITYCMKKSPDERPGSAQIIANQLKHISSRVTNPTGQNTAEFFAVNVSSSTNHSLNQISYAGPASDSGIVRPRTTSPALQASTPQGSAHPSQVDAPQESAHPSQPHASPHLTDPALAGPSAALRVGVVVGIVGMLCLGVALWMVMGRDASVPAEAVSAAITSQAQAPAAPEPTPSPAAPVVVPQAPAAPEPVPVQPKAAAPTPEVVAPAVVAPAAVAPVATPVKRRAKRAPVPQRRKVAPKKSAPAAAKPTPKVVSKPAPAPAPKSEPAVKRPTKTKATKPQPAKPPTSDFFGDETKAKAKSSDDAFLPMK